jgi:hypothetical protein
MLSPEQSGEWQHIGLAHVVCPYRLYNNFLRSSPLLARPHDEERVKNPIPPSEFDPLLERSAELLNVHNDQYNDSIRHTVVKETIQTLPQSRGVTSLPLGVERRTDNPEYVTWTGSNTILGDVANNPRFTLGTEMRVTALLPDPSNPGRVAGVKVRNLNTNNDEIFLAQVRLTFILICIWH